ncbi:IclR family transcriptional regulator [Yinghuangia aomiensis]|uniref:IclR family transcriptional regulator n=1 Tax=Yinghuangia aomiensis TaxID=676205 RepID=A0ABP9ICF7_9ACTN
MDSAETSDPRELRTLTRGLAVLDEIVNAEGRATAKSIAHKLGLSQSTCYQMLKTLELTGHVVHTPAGFYEVGPSISAMFRRLRMSLTPDPRVSRALHALRDETGDTAYACVLRGNSILLQEIAEGRNTLVVRMLQPGTRDHVHARASCRAILSQLSDLERKQILPTRSLPKLTKYTVTQRAELRKILNAAFVNGYATERQEFEEGVCCVSAPFFDLAGTVAGSLTVAMPEARLDANEASIARKVMFHASEASHPAARPELRL